MVYHPNKYQKKIFDFVKNGSGNAIVEAVAGSGKTTVIVNATTLISNKKKIAFLCFNKSISNELRTKLPKYVRVSTLHSVGKSLFYKNGIDHIVDEKKMQRIIKHTLSDFKDIAEKRELENFLSDIVPMAKLTMCGTDKESLQSLPSYYATSITDDRAKLVDIILNECLETVTIDFDDMVWIPVIKKYDAPKYDWVFIDECLPAMSRVILSDGSEKTIKEIVDNKLQCNALSYNHHLEKQESKPIVGWSKIPIGRKKMLKIELSQKHSETKYTDPSEYFPLRFFYCTGNHKVFVYGEGYIRADHLEVGDKLYDRSLETFEILSIEEIDFKEEYVYDITVADNHNFYSEGVLVHNCQDISKTQFELIKMLCNDHTRIVAVGDSKQSMYGFRCADSNSMSNFKSYFNATEFPLSICYRCPKKVVERAQKIVPQIESPSNAPDGIVDFLTKDEMIDKAQDDDLILCRTNAPLVDVTFSLIRQGKKATIKGRNNMGKYLLSNIESYRTSSLSTLIWSVQRRKNVQGELLERMMREKIYDPKLKQRTLQSIDICDTILSLATNATNITDLENKVKLIFSPTSTGITCSTIHKVKGLENDRVFIYRYDLMPHPMAETKEELQEERNIEYVAITRAKKELYFVPDETF